MTEHLSDMDTALDAERLDNTDLRRQVEQWKERVHEVEVQLTRRVAEANMNRAEQLEHSGIQQD